MTLAKRLKFFSVCSGIEAASVAWPFMDAVAFVEREAFPSAVLACRHPGVPNLGDMTKWREWSHDLLAEADVLVGGTPCQAFSVAGLRKSLDDDRGNLSLEFVRLADAIDDVRLRAGKQPAVILWENVPGVLSVKDNAFGCYLAGLAGDVTPYDPPRGKWTDSGVVAGPQRAVAWRVLDAQYFGLAQRRRRVFVVSSARAGFDPAAVLFEWEGVRRDTPPSREAGQIAPTIPARSLGGGGLGTDFDCDGGVIRDWPADLAPTLNAHFGEKQGLEDQHIRGGGDYSFPAISQCLNAGGMGRRDWETETFIPTIGCVFDEVAHTLKGEGFDASEDGTGRGTPLVPVAFPANPSGTQCAASENIAPAMGAKNPTAVAVPLQEVGKRTGTSTDDPRAGIGIGQDGDPMFTLQAGAQHGVAAYAFQPRIARNGRGDMGEVVNALNAQSGETGKGDAAPCVAVAGAICRDSFSGGAGGRPEGAAAGHFVPTAMAVRRLTPIECERLQGFPDNYTLIPWRNKPAADCPDGPRYKALGNSMAVPCMRWIGRRIFNLINREEA